MDRQSPDVEWTRCRYFTFWDIPRCLVLQHRGRTLLFDCPFSEDLDDYEPNYHVWELQSLEPELAQAATLEDLERHKTRALDDLPVTAMEFRREREKSAGRCYAWCRLKPIE